jgi:hypothetical protein
MMKFLSFFKAKTERDYIEEYLAEAVDLVDLENRLRLIDRNQAPWQIKASQPLKGWM